MLNEPKEQILVVIDKLQLFTKEIQEWIVTNKTLTDMFQNTISEVRWIINPESFEWRKFEAWKTKNYQYISDRNNWSYASSDKMIQDLISILIEVTWIDSIKDEEHFWSNEEYRLRRHLTKLFKSAKNEILILDNYFDTNIFNFIEETDDSIKIKLLGWENKIKIGFKNLFLSCDRKNLECKVHNTTTHSRFIIIDSSEIFSMLASLNWMGTNETSILKINDLNKINEIYSLWNISLELNK